LARFFCSGFLLPQLKTKASRLIKKTRGFFLDHAAFLTERAITTIDDEWFGAGAGITIRVETLILTLKSAAGVVAVKRAVLHRAVAIGTGLDRFCACGRV
jgi:hypothetical protein